MAKLTSMFTASASEEPEGFKASSRWSESTLEVARWDRIRHASSRWAIWGGILGFLMGLVAFAPATWLTKSVADWTGQRVLLAEAQGTIWRGNAIAVLTGGPGSRDASALPGRLSWQWQLKGTRLQLLLMQDCCLKAPLVVSVQPGWRKVSAELSGQASAAAARWPAAWLIGLGAPWNTLQLNGTLGLTTSGLRAEWSQGKLTTDGQAQLLLTDVSSRVSPLDRLGTYALDVQGLPGGQMGFELSTQEGALQLQGRGQLGASGLRFQGQASASEAERESLNNLLNIIGRRSGDRAYISIG